MSFCASLSFPLSLPHPSIWNVSLASQMYYPHVIMIIGHRIRLPQLNLGFTHVCCSSCFTPYLPYGAIRLNALVYIKHLEQYLVHSKHSQTPWTPTLLQNVYSFSLPSNFKFQNFMHLVWNLKSYECTFDILLDLLQVLFIA